MRGPLLKRITNQTSYSRFARCRELHVTHSKPQNYPPGSNRPSQSSEAHSSKSQSRISRLNARLPLFLQNYTRPLIHAPTTHITSFLILHEITAVVPLFGLAGLFYYSGWAPSWVGEWKGVDEGVKRFTKYFRRKGWIGEQDEREVQALEQGTMTEPGREGARVVLAFATAYAITKALLPFRLILSAWATPWFARIFVNPIVGISQRILGRATPGAIRTATPAAGTGAIGGSVRASSPKAK